MPCRPSCEATTYTSKLETLLWVKFGLFSGKNSRIKLSQKEAMQRNLQKFSPAKVSGYTVLAMNTAAGGWENAIYSTGSQLSIKTCICTEYRHMNNDSEILPRYE